MFIIITRSSLFVQRDSCPLVANPLLPDSGATLLQFPPLRQPITLRGAADSRIVGYQDSRDIRQYTPPTRTHTYTHSYAIEW